LKIRCAKILDQFGASTSVSCDSWLTVGSIYLVLGVYGRGSSIKFRVMSDEGVTPALHDANQFEIIAPEIPNSWIFRTFPNSEWQLIPAAWAGKGFWEAYFDRDAAARSLFDAEVAAMQEAK